LSAAFERFSADKVDAVFVLPDVMLANAADSIAKLALQHRLPVMAWGTWFTGLGCLMAYSADYESYFPLMAEYVDKILKGTDPGELPIEQPTTFILSINMKTAAALGVTPPESVLLAADLVFE
jgi:putative ABC transport system substrate-binding protein